MKRYRALIFAVLLVSIFLGAKALKIAYVYVGPVGDAGWTYAHDLGRQYVEKVFGDAIKTDFIESVPEGAESESVIRSYAQRGYDLIFATSFGYMDSVINVAKKYPKTIFMHCSGFKTAENVGTYFGRIYEPDFLSGLIAGIMTKSNVIGYVAAYPIPEVVRGINAFALGVEYVNPTAKVHVIWVNSWYDPALEKEAAISLLNIDADVIAQGQDSPAAQQAAEEYGVYSVGYNSDMEKFAPKSYLGAPVWNWGPYYEKVIKEVMTGTWKNEEYWGGLADGVVDIDISDLVPDTVKKLVSVFKESIISGTFHPFVGPLYDQDGNLRVPAGDVPSDHELLSMDWFVNNVVGTVPKQ